MQYDYGARFYNPEIGLWGSVDPLAEKYYSVSPYVYCMNNPMLYVDPDGRDPGIWDVIAEYLTSFFSQAKPGHNEEIYERAYVENDKEAQKEIQQTETVQTILNTEITPYVSVNVGKETGETGPLSAFGGLTFTQNGIYVTGGLDQSVGTPSIFTGISFSISFGIFVGPESGITGSGIGGGGGSIIGVSGSAPFPGSEGPSTVGLGLTIGNTPAWSSVNASYTLPVMKFQNEKNRK